MLILLDIAALMAGHEVGLAHLSDQAEATLA